MRKNPRARKLANRLLSLCRDENGRISAERVDEVLQALRKNPPSDHRAVLQSLSFLVERDLAASTARVTSGGELSAESIEQIRTSFTQKYNRPIEVESKSDDSLIAGTRVQVGDDVYEISIPSRLASISA
tara:strand:- start:5357 stop:5746 length:390 start_codon:yes stop_codon:yes gene_type:complete